MATAIPSQFRAAVCPSDASEDRDVAGGPWPLRKSLTVVTTGWFFGSVWMNTTAGAPLTLFAKGLNATPFHFGLMAALPFLASLVSLPASLLIERTGQRKKIFLFSLYTQRLMWIAIALAPLLMVHWYGQASAGRAMGMFLCMMLFMHTAGAFGGPAWVSWMADVVPNRLRGRFFARRRQWGLYSAIPATLAVGWLLDHYGHGKTPLYLLQWCAGIFIVASLFGFADIHAFQYLAHRPKPPRAGRELIRALGQPLADRRFLCFGSFVGVLTFGVSFTGQFVALYLIERVKVGGMALQTMLLAGPMIAQLAVLPAWGRACDRIGRKPVLAVAALGMVPTGIGWCFVTPNNPWLGYVLAAGGAVLWAGVEIANFNLVLEMSGADPKRGGSGYVAINTVIVNVAGCLGGCVAGAIAQSLQDWTWQPIQAFKAFSSYDVLFALGGLVRLLAVAVFLPLIQEPASRGTAECMRFMCANIYNNVHHAVLQPIRCLSVLHHREPVSRRSDMAELLQPDKDVPRREHLVRAAA